MNTLRKMWHLLYLAALCAAAIGQAQAATISSQFADLGNHKWRVNLALTNDSDAAVINEFTVYFSQNLFTDLVALSSPSAWDSILAQPDLSLSSAGYFDSFNVQGLGFGATQGGFTIGFTFLGQGAPGALPFDIVGPDFLPISSGSTIVEATAVPEPATAWLALAGCVAFAGRRQYRQPRQHRRQGAAS